MPAEQNEVAPDVRELVRGNTTFALDLFARQSEMPGNIFLSPYSISAALGMTFAGARGETERQMAEVLHFTLGQERLHPAFAALQARLAAIQEAGHVRLSEANSLWPQQAYPFLAPFLAVCRAYYGVSITGLDYGADPAGCRLLINAWAEERTSGRIQGLIPPGVLDELTRLVLVNAIFFKGNWLSRFDEKRTEPAAFHCGSGVDVPVPMMAQQGEFGYAAFDGFQVLEMPYEGEDLSMVVLLPGRVDGLPELERALTAEQVALWLERLAPREVQLFLPRFRLEFKVILNRVLAALGMGNAFDPDLADFSGLDGYVHWLYIALAIHQAFVEVNEEGTEAAAATAVVIKARSVPPPVPTFRADRPFLFLIRERMTGSILFLGRVADPGAG